jgi:hypothetical protein
MRVKQIDVAALNPSISPHLKRRDTDRFSVHSSPSSEIRLLHSTTKGSVLHLGIKTLCLASPPFPLLHGDTIA